MLRRRRSRAILGLAHSTIGWRELLNEVVAGVLQRPGRSMLTALGTVLGIGAFVAVLGLTATANGQISERFNALTATEVVIEQDSDVAPPGETLAFPQDAEARIASLNGARSSGVYWRVGQDHRVTGLPPGVSSAAGSGEDVSVIAATAGLWQAIHPRLQSGRTFDDFHERRGERVAVLGAGLARRLGITDLSAMPAVFVDEIPFTVVGLLADVDRETSTLLAVTIPATTARDLWGLPADPARMLIETELGAARVVGSQAPMALRPDAPDLFKPLLPPDPRSLREGVTSDLNTLFLLLAGVSLLVGAVGIANTTLVAVMERVPEIGLRRALGARGHHIGAQFLLESTALGGLGGLVGTSLGVLVVVLVAMANDWTAVLAPWTVVAAPLVGAVTGLLAGLYPAVNASRIEPVEALRR